MQFPHPSPRRTLAAGLGLAALSCAGGVHAQELAFMGGILTGNGGNHTYSWALDYQEGLGPHLPNLAAGFTWYNEGHIPNHHRDGQAAQLWGRLPLMDRRLVLSAGAGPYRYFDTTAAGNGARYSDTHGWGVLFSARAAYYTSHRWVALAQLNHATVFGEPDTTSIMFGIAYQLDAPSTPGPRDEPLTEPPLAYRNEITAMVGQTVLNSRDSPAALGGSLEYRRAIARNLDWSATYLYEGSSESVRRNGLATQFWLTRDFFAERLSLGVGAGAYLAVSQRHPVHADSSDDRLAGLISISASYRFVSNWDARVTWSRVMTNYNRDTDVIQAGIGYRF